MRLMIGLMCALLTTTFAAAQDFEHVDQSFDALVSNGHWECRCFCNDGAGDFELALIPGGKCDDDTEGSFCQYKDEGVEVYGVLQECSNIFIIDDEDKDVSLQFSH